MLISCEQQRLQLHASVCSVGQTGGQLKFWLWTRARGSKDRSRRVVHALSLVTLQVQVQRSRCVLIRPPARQKHPGTRGSVESGLVLALSLQDDVWLEFFCRGIKPHSPFAGSSFRLIGKSPEQLLHLGHH